LGAVDASYECGKANVDRKSRKSHPKKELPR
jgi:hypothetical protein